MTKRIGEDCYPDYEEITDRLCYANTLQTTHADLQEGMRLMRNERRFAYLRELVSQKQEILESFTQLFGTIRTLRKSFKPLLHLDLIHQKIFSRKLRQNQLRNNRV